MNKIFLTGGAGYIGSHACVELLKLGYDVVIYDNFSNSNLEVIKRVENITGKTVQLIEGDIRDESKILSSLIGCDAVIHFAGLKAVAESVTIPLEYYDNNVQGTLCLLRTMQKLNIKKLVFSSSATVYGIPQVLPLVETHPLSATNPYGQTKLMIENILRDLYLSDSSWKIVLLRYFNPVGAHETGLIGEDPKGIPNNLMPFISQVAVGKQEYLNVYGNDYPTRDGTGVRDYIHVVDLAIGHLKALENIEKMQCTAINLGTGKGYSVLEMLEVFTNVSQKEIPYKIQPRRTGDVAECYADASLAKELIGWEAVKSLDDMCKDTWKWQTQNPFGYEMKSELF